MPSRSRASAEQASLRLPRPRRQYVAGCLHGADRRCDLGSPLFPEEIQEKDRNPQIGDRLAVEGCNRAGQARARETRSLIMVMSRKKKVIARTAHKLRPKAPTVAETTKVTPSSGNVFADIGIPNAREH